jgi:flagellar protein FliS
MTPMNSYTSYNQTRIYTATQRELLVMLYDGAIRFLKVARQGVEEKDIEKAHTNLIKAKRIVSELISTLNTKQGELASNLFSLYNYLFKKIVEANVKKEINPIEECIGILSTLREGWAELKGKTAEELRGKVVSSPGGNSMKA